MQEINDKDKVLHEICTLLHYQVNIITLSDIKYYISRQ